MFTNINGLHGNRYELAIAATKFDVVVCAETKVTGRRLVILRIAVGTLMTVPLPMPGGVH